MRPLLFATRMAFICNMLFILCLIIQRTYDFIPNKDLSFYGGIIRLDGSPYTEFDCEHLVWIGVSQ
jgi:hypothetical protein